MCFFGVVVLLMVRSFPGSSNRVQGEHMRLTFVLLMCCLLCGVSGCNGGSDVPEELRAPPLQPITPADKMENAPKGAVPAEAL